MLRPWYIVLLTVLALPLARANAQGPDAPEAAAVRADLHAAAEALRGGDYRRSAELAAPLAENPAIERTDRAEAHRLYGLALFFLGRHGDAEAALLEYLKLDVDAHLDPALVPPEAIVFFEDVRSRHAAELRALRPKPKQKRYAILNVLPPAGQLQNGHRGKAIAIGAGGVLLLGANLGSYLVLRDWCGADKTCGDHTDDARTLRIVNLASGIMLIGLYAYGVGDAAWHYYRRPDEAHPEPMMSVGVAPTAGGAYVSLGGRF
jgi:hypothetical protein